MILNDSVFACLLVGKAEKVVRKIARQVHCKGDIATQETYRRYFASFHADYIYR